MASVKDVIMNFTADVSPLELFDHILEDEDHFSLYKSYANYPKIEVIEHFNVIGKKRIHRKDF